jgi:hypothetical protein
MRRKLIHYAVSSGLERTRFSGYAADDNGHFIKDAHHCAVLYNHIGKCAEHNWPLAPQITKAYFPLTRHGQRRKRRLQQFFVAVGTSLTSCCTATIPVYKNDPQTCL